MNRPAEVLTALAAHLRLRSYLEIGCYNNATFHGVDVAGPKVGVDPKKGGTLRMTSDEFFRENRQTFDLVFVDGLHHAEQVQRDVLNAVACLNPGGVVAVHDCLPTLEEHQMRHRVLHSWTGDVWKGMTHLRARPDLDACTLAVKWGLGVILRRTNTQPLVDVPDPLDWAAFEEHRDRLLRVVDWDGLLEFLNPSTEEDRGRSVKGTGGTESGGCVPGGSPRAAQGGPVHP